MGDYNTQGLSGISVVPQVMPLGIQNLPPIPSSTPTPGPILIQASPVDGYHVRVTYAEPVVVSDATLALNYDVPGLLVFDVVSESNTVYVIRTSLQTPGTTYTITANNVRALGPSWTP